ncbi:HNH endonuclease [Polyangium sorediatum]|uniref:HNH endonuclease n=1 Tax=Polyangium sorediatum TaxID=889274 RepID=A0ABT6NN95_9BACT|nr:HNH endonuclease [Polyangium sorediatum]MDI1429801.1 HNH endonuclease [Polyangium sorediatum]
MASRRAFVSSLHLRLWMLGALRFFRRGLLGLVALGVSAWLLGCGAATRVPTEAWAQELHGKSVFRVCRRHPRVGANTRYWYELGDGVHRPAFEPLEKLLENPSVKAVFIHDPHASPESRRLLGLAYQDLPCDKPPPPPPSPPPPEKIAAKESEATPSKRTTVRTETRTSAIRPCERPRNRPPDQRFVGQTAPTPAPAPGMSAPCPPPPPGSTYEEQKVNLARRDAEEEARRTGERIGREWGATLGKADELPKTFDRPFVALGKEGEFKKLFQQAPPERAEQIQADLARQLNAIPDLPTYEDERLARIAWEAFLKGYGRGWADAELKAAILNALADTALTLATMGAAGLETAGARALRAAQQRLRSMPVFLPSAAGGPGGFLRRPKLPGPPAASPPKAAAPPSGTTVTTTTKPVTGPNGAAGQAGAARPRNAHLAGKKHPETGVPFDPEGYPDFKAAGVVKKEVKINQTGNRRADDRLANKEAGLTETPEGYTWHHHQDGKTMQLVPKDIHGATGHTGGVATQGRQ